MRKSLLTAVLLTACAVFADQVEMKNGDRYNGRVLSLTPDSVVLQNDVLGKITLPRAKISLLSVGGPAVAPPSNSSPSSVNSNNAASNNIQIAAALRQLGADTNLIAQVRGQFLAGAGPAANQKFDDTMQGLMSGKIDMAGLRAQAKSAADQLRAYQRQLGPDAGDSFNSYLAILDNFLQETGSSTNR
jgi:hypothetical protein